MKLLDKLFCIFNRNKKVGLALGGGVARGFAHIGVLKVLKKHKIPIHFISGTSSGAIIGALFAAGMNPDDMEIASKRLGWLRFVKIVMAKRGPASTEEIERFIVKNIGNINFSELTIPFAVVASDLKSGKEVVISEGNVAEAVAASSSVPGFFVPFKKDQYLLVDGGLTNNVPSSAAKSLGADFVVAVDVVPAGFFKNDLDNAFQILGRMIDLAQKKLSEEGRRIADVLIEPKIPHNIWHIDIDKAAKLIEVGEQEAEKHILGIKAKLYL